MSIKGLGIARNRLVFPSRPPGVDRNHVALRNATGYASLIAIPGSANLINISSGVPGTTGGNQTITSGTNVIGAYAEYNPWTASSTCFTQIPAPVTGTPTALTFGVIFVPISTVTSNDAPITGTNSTGALPGNGIERRPSGHICVFTTSFGGQSDPGAPITVSNNVPYFAAVSVIAGTQNYVLLNLKTGSVVSKVQSSSLTLVANGTNWCFGGLGVAQASAGCCGSQISAVTQIVTKSLLSITDLLTWAADPWSFWYPDRTFAVSNVFMSQAPQGAAVIDVPLGFVPRTWVPGWSPTRAFLLNTAQDFSSSAVETNPHWQGKTYPPQWLADRKLLINHRAVVESSSAVETNPHTTFKTLPPQWVKNPILLLNTAQDFSSSAVETNPHWKGIQWPPQWAINKPLFRVTAQDFSASAVETNVHAIFKTWPPQWQPLAKLRQTDPQDFSSSAVETNPHWLGKTWPPQWTLILKQSFDPNPSTQVQPETNVHFIPRTYPPQWAPLKNLQNTAQDLSSSAVETNVHTIFTTWPPQWKQTINLLLNTDTLAPTFQPETNVHFIPRTWAPQWVLLLRTQNTAQDFSSSAVETNPHWIGRPWPSQWAPAISLRQEPATDVPAITFDTPPHTVFRTWLPQWLINLPLLRSTSQDFSSTAVETNVHFIPRTWPPQWNLQASLKQGTAQDFSTTPPAFVEIYENQFFSAFARIGAIGRNP